MSQNKSIWSETVEKPQFSALEGDKKTDVLVIGGGIAGVLCLHRLKNAGVDAILVEAKEICDGITKNTTAKLTVQHGLIYDKIIKKYGKEAAEMYFVAQDSALKEYRRLCAEINCDFEEKASFVYSLDDCKKILREYEALQSIGRPAVFSSKANIPLSFAGAVGIEHQAQFNPLKFLYGIASGLPIFEDTKVIELRGNVALTNRGKILFQKAIVATHFPFMNKYGSYFLKMYQHRSYVLGLEGAPDIDGMYVDEDLKGLSFRNYEGLLLFGGGSHRTGKQGGGWQELRDLAKLYYPRAKVVTQWATQDCITLDGIPYIGLYSSKLADIYVITGFNKWGMTSSMAGAMVLADLVAGKKNDFAGVFSPQRSILHSQLLLNGAESILNLITPTTPRCSHLGCALKYNKQEHTWDCPCHGSRFTDKGEVIDNPATDDKKNI
ncbi:MAG: FAD-dependent oxidoreductase [Clostridia bacterium]|nr:FAD-dependent oxidoreductase [Clostridia bacterium]